MSIVDSHFAKLELRDRRVRNANLRTQKAKGIRAITDTFGSTLPFDIVQNFWDIHEQTISYPLFARPCPTRPRHGFVDSRVVENAGQLYSLLLESQKVDPNAELITMPVNTDAIFNMILTPAGASIGPSHDGATSGINSVFYPVAHLSLSDRLRKRAGLAETDAPFFEFLRTKDYDDYMVQLRGGISAEGKGNYIPRDIKVTHVYSIDNPKTHDLVEFEQACKRFDGNTVLYHPGGTRLSHFSMHFLTHDMAIVFDKKPMVGDVLLRTEETTEQYNADLIAQGLQKGYTLPLDQSEYAKAVHTALYALHHASVLRGEYSFIIGLGLGLFVRASVAANLGEYRHYSGATLPVRGEQSDYPECGDPDCRQCEHEYCAPSRHSVYEVAFDDIQEAWNYMDHAFNSYATGSWSSGFGGGKWASCALSTIRLVNRIAKFQQDRLDVAGLLAAFNRAVNQAHNNGFFLNKFVSSNSFDSMANGDADTLATSLFDMHTLMCRKQTQRRAIRLPMLSVEIPNFVIEFTGYDLYQVTFAYGWRGTMQLMTVSSKTNPQLYGALIFAMRSLACDTIGIVRNGCHGKVVKHEQAINALRRIYPELEEMHQCVKLQS